MTGMARLNTSKLIASSPAFASFRETIITSKITPAHTQYIATHNGTFHCDEALAVSLLKLLPQFKNHVILRTRDTKLLTPQLCDAIVDVGGVYDPNRGLFDHHQRGFQETYSDTTHIKLSSAGLIFRHYGPQIVDCLSQLELDDTPSLSLTSETKYLVLQKLYTSFMEHIDGIDNGTSVSASSQVAYDISTTLSNRVNHLNPFWNDPDQYSELYVNSKFQTAMTLTLTEFLDAATYILHVWLPARSLVLTAVQNRHTVHHSGQILHFPQYCPWKAHLYDIEKELNLPKSILFVLYRDSVNDSYRIQAVNVESGSFALRQSMKKEWLGLRDEELSIVSGIEDCIFVHGNGFIGGNKRLEGALQMAIDSLP